METKRKYTIEEIRLDKNLLIYINEELEWRLIRNYCLKEYPGKKLLTDGYHGQHCYNLYDATWSSSSSKTKPGAYYSPSSVIITFDQLCLIPIYNVGDVVIVKSYKQCGIGNGILHDNSVCTIVDMSVEATGLNKPDYKVKSETQKGYFGITKDHIIERAPGSQPQPELTKDKRFEFLGTPIEVSFLSNSFTKSFVLKLHDEFEKGNTNEFIEFIAKCAETFKK